MNISKEEIHHIAELSRLDLSEEEIEKYREQLGEILDYIKVLREVKTDNIELTAQVNGLIDVFREDTVKEWSKQEISLALEQGDRENGSLVVKKVL